MHQLTKSQIGTIMDSAGMIPVFYHPDADIVKQVIKACYDGGCRVFEYTNRGENAKNNYPLLKQFVEEQCPGMILGIGTIINVFQAKEFVELGADFIVSPILDKKTGKWCFKNDIYWIPGCGTLTECIKALSFGADLIKLFPGNVLGPGFVKAVLGPLPMLRLMSTGGVEPTENNLGEWFKAGVVCVGMGSQLISSEMIKNKEFSRLEEEVRNVFTILTRLKSKRVNTI
jgi:2-dehydro-3-deoxyphosphogluconate aldolase / (4S)-4-hydroxy-2-oxoglutarate aldolase